MKPLTVQKMWSGSFKNNKMCLEIIYSIYMNKDLALNNLH